MVPLPIVGLERKGAATASFGVPGEAQQSIIAPHEHRGHARKGAPWRRSSAASTIFCVSSQSPISSRIRLRMRPSPTLPRVCAIIARTH